MPDPFDLKTALREVKVRLHQHLKIKIRREHWLENRKKVILEPDHGVSFLVHFKRDFFRSYGAITGEGGLGESVNVAHFEKAVYDLGVGMIIYIYPKGRIYFVETHKIKPNSLRWKNKATGDEQYLFSIDLLKPLLLRAEKPIKQTIPYEAKVKSRSLEEFR